MGALILSVTLVFDLSGMGSPAGRNKSPTSIALRLIIGDSQNSPTRQSSSYLPTPLEVLEDDDDDDDYI